MTVRLRPIAATLALLAAPLSIPLSAPLAAQQPMRVLRARPLTATNQPRTSAPPQAASQDTAAEVPEVETTLDPTIAALADEIASAGLDAAALRERAQQLYDRSIARHGDLELVGPYLEALVEDAGDGSPIQRAATRVRGHLAWRHGDLRDALQRFEFLAETSAEGPDLDAELARANVLDALGRGKDALAAYGELVPLLGDEDVLRVRLRMAMISMETGDEEQKDALADFAREEGQSLELRNRCAIVLALLGRPGDAADLYAVPPLDAEDALGPSERKKQRKAAGTGELRIAEWAVRAEDWPRAQGAAWRAMQLSTVKREIRYALTLLAEAHRGDDTLGALLERFSAERDTLRPESREAWIDLLRETGSYDEAIGMVSGASIETFSREERRRLLEMYREAGREDEMVEVYRRWIEAEPEELLWRGGLCRHFLEEGDRTAAAKLWTDWFDALAASGQVIPDPLDAADALEGLGLDELAMRAAEAAIAAPRDGSGRGESAFLFLYDLHRNRGRLDDARRALERLDAYADAGSPARMPLSDCFERLGELEEAVRVLENVREARGVARAGEDLEMRLAWLYSEVGHEDQALELWRDLWTRVKSVARRRFVEDRMMTVAARLGVLADIAVELERKLYAGEATERDSGLLVRLYTKVGDAVSAAEILDEFLALNGGTQLEALTEKARVYLACNDYYHYEKAVDDLIAIDPEGKPDYFRQLAMSQLERGKPDQARETLLKLQGLPGESDDSSAEFEAGVLALSGLRDEAIAAYRRGLAAHPERIDSYLLMANLMKEVRQSDRAVGMFQYLAEMADRDDLFTIAIDGCLNMLVDAAPRPKMVQWARRITLERIAGREDAPYLYQLLADLAEETGDGDGQLAALENSLSSAGPRRASVLRELMDLSKPARGGFNQPSRDGDRSQLLAFGRRLVGLGELVPPEVYLDLGDAFLEDGDEASAARTFDLTREFPDGELYQQQAAERFEKAGFVDRALERYQAVLAASPTDVPLLAKVGELREALGDDPGALELYRLAFEVLMGREPLYELAKEEDDSDGRRWIPRNVDEYDQYIERVLQGMLATFADDAAVAAFVREQRGLVEAELPLAVAAREASEGPAEGPEEGGASTNDDETRAPRLAAHPRLVARAELVRRIAFATDDASEADALDRWALAAFPGDDDLLTTALEARVRWGRFAGARALVDASGAEGETRDALLARLGGSSVAAEGGGRPIPFDAAVASILPLFAKGDLEGVRQVARRADLTQVDKARSNRIAVLLAAARATGDDELLLRIGRDWLRVDLAGDAYPYALENRIDGLLGLMGHDTGLALAQYFVSRVLEDPEKNSKFVTILPKLTQRFGSDVVDTEDVRTLLDGFGDRYAWGLGPVLALLPEKDRAGALRGVWGKLEATNRASFLLDLVTESTEDLPQELCDFIVESMPEAMDKADDFIQYSVGELVEVEHSHQLVVDIARIIQEARPDFEHAKATEIIHRHALGEADLITEAAEIWAMLAASESTDYSVRRAKDKLTEKIAKDDPDSFLGALSAKVMNDGASPRLTKAQVDLLRSVDRDAEAEKVLAAALAEEPEDLELLASLRSVQRSRGQRIAAAETLETMASLEKNDATKKRHYQSLVREWTALHAPERALVAKGEIDEEESESGIPGLPPGYILPVGATIIVNGVAYTGGQTSAKKGLPKSFKDVREAMDDEAVDEGRILRRLWRQFPVGQPKPRPTYGFARYRSLPLANLTWPADVDPAEDAAEAESEPEEPESEDSKKAGYLGFDPNEPEPRPDPPSAYERINASPALVAEQRRFLRSVSSVELDRLQKLLEGLLDFEAAEGGEGALLGGLLAKAQAGDTGRADQIRLLALLDRFPERVTGDAAEALSELVQTIPPRDAAQVRRLARVLLQSGQTEVALRLYGWCALQAPGVAAYGGDDDLDVVTYVSNRDLVQEARDHLEGEAQLSLIQTVLETSKPVDSPWQRENYEDLVLETWDEIVGSAQARERARQIVDDSFDLSKGLRRRIARRAVGLLLAAGERDHALRAFEVGLAKLDPADVAQPEERWYRHYPKNEGRLTTADLRRLFPPAGGDIPEAAEWFLGAAASLESWWKDERYAEASAVQALSLIAIRLAEVDHLEEAKALAQRLAEADDLTPTSTLWVIDALRALGFESEASTRERALLAEGRLHPERIADAVAAVLARDGPEAALTAAAPVSEVLRHPRFLDVLIEAATAQGDDEAIAKWTAAKEAAQAAREELEKA